MISLGIWLIHTAYFSANFPVHKLVDKYVSVAYHLLKNFKLIWLTRQSDVWVAIVLCFWAYSFAGPHVTTALYGP